MKPNLPIRVFLVDDHGLLRLGLATLIELNDDLKVVGNAENGEEAVERVCELKPDVVVMDLMMPVLDGVGATQRIKERLPETRVLILTSYGTSADVTRAVQAGASGALVKDTPNEDLIDSIRKVAAGERVFSPEIERAITEEPVPPEFTERQLEVLTAVTRGYTNAEIGKMLGISADAVRQHIMKICETLGAANRAEAVAIALRKHLLKA